MAASNFKLPRDRKPDVFILRDVARDSLIHILESVGGRKDLVLDSELMRPLDRIAGAKLLKEHGVDKIFKLEPGKPLPYGCEQRLYLVRPQMTTMKYIADHINADKQESRTRKYKVVLTPRKLHTCEIILENEGVFGALTLDELPLDLIPLDQDLMSLELPEFYPAFFLEGDQTWLHTVAKSIIQLQTLFGTIPNVYGQGRCAKMVADMVKVMHEHEQGETKDSEKYEIGHMFLIDRDVDYVTPLCSQVTYEGLLDETFGIHSGYCEFGPKVTGTDKSLKLLLTSDDPVFEEIRYRHFSHVLGLLRSKARTLQTDYDKRHGMNITEMKQFVSQDLKRLKQDHKSLALHISACENIMGQKTKENFEEALKNEHSIIDGVDMRNSIEVIESRVNRQFPLTNVLKQLCLLSVVQNGLSGKDYKSLTSQLVHSYGHEHLVTLFNLKKLGLLTEQTASTGDSVANVGNLVAAIQKKSSFKAVSKKLSLIPKGEYNVINPEDMAYVFSGAYTPLSCKLVEQVLSRGGWAGLDDVCKLLPGINFAHLSSKSTVGGGNVTGEMQSASRVVLVYFLGGCSYAEVAALRFLGRQKGYKFIVATTNIINNKTLFDEILYKPPQP